MSNPFATVGLKNVSTGTPTIWVNDIPGISSELATALRTSDAPAALAVWEKVQRLGLEKLTSLIENELSKSADFVYSKTEAGSLYGNPLDGVMVNDSYYVGYQISGSLESGDELLIKSFKCDSNSVDSDSTVIKVFDGSGKELFSKDATIVTGYNELEIGYLYRSRFGKEFSLFICVNAEDLNLLSIGKGQNWANSSVNLAGGKSKLSSDHSWDTIVPDLDVTLMLAASIRRSLSDVIKRYSDRLGWAYAYVCASLLMSEKLASPNFNLYTNTNRGYTEEQIPAMMDEAVTRIRPIARDMLKELNRAEAVTPKTDRPFDAGYSVDSYC